MNQCEFCHSEVQKSGFCPNCGTTLYTARGTIIYGLTPQDKCSCEVSITEKYLLIRKESSAETKGKALSKGFGLLGALTAEVASSSNDHSYGFYKISDIQKGIFPYQANGIKKKNAIKIINKDSSDFILIIDKPGFIDGTAKALKIMVEKMSALFFVEDGNSMNFGNVLCAKPCVNGETFCKKLPDEKPIIYEEPIQQPPVASPLTASVTPQRAPIIAENPVVPIEQPLAEQAEKNSDDRLTCSACGFLALAGSKFCSNCGAKIEPLPQKRFCTNCGNELLEGDNFCCLCGKKAN